MAVIDLEDVWKRFRVRRNLVEAVLGVNLHVEAGEIFGFLGPNGAGKTTTLRMLATLLSPDKGKGSVAGYDLVRQPARVRERIGYVGQQGGTGYTATGREHMLLQAKAYHSGSQEARQRILELIAQLEMGPFVDRPVRTYSGGQRRRLDLALGIVHRPEVLFLDEPSLGLDPQSRKSLWEEVRQLRSDGTTVFLTTHYLEEADALCDRVAIINDGVIVAEGTPEQLKQRLAGDMIAFGLAHPDETLPQAQELIQAQPFVRAAQLHEQELQVYVEHGGEALLPLLRLLEEAGLRVETISLARPTLDDAFLQQVSTSSQTSHNSYEDHGSRNNRVAASPSQPGAAEV